MGGSVHSAGSRFNLNTESINVHKVTLLRLTQNGTLNRINGMDQFYMGWGETPGCSCDFLSIPVVSFMCVGILTVPFVDLSERFFFLFAWAIVFSLGLKRALNYH